MLDRLGLGPNPVPNLKVLQVVGAMPPDISGLPRHKKYKGVHLHDE